MQFVELLILLDVYPDPQSKYFEKMINIYIYFIIYSIIILGLLPIFTKYIWSTVITTTSLRCRCKLLSGTGVTIPKGHISGRWIFHPMNQSWIMKSCATKKHLVTIYQFMMFFSQSGMVFFHPRLKVSVKEFCKPFAVCFAGKTSQCSTNPRVGKLPQKRAVTKTLVDCLS